MSIRTMNVLMLTHRLPYAPNRGDRIRADHILRFLANHARVHLVSLVHDEEEAERASDLSDVASITCVPTRYWTNRVKALVALPSRRPLTHVLLDGKSLQTSFSKTP